MSDAEGVRLQKVLARSGIASRRKCEVLMSDGRVEVDGEIITQLGARVDPQTARIRVDGKRLPVAEGKVYLAAHKPRGVVSSMSDERGRRDLRELVGDRPERLFHVGRLDTDTDGLIVLTNDGDFAHTLAHPSFELLKTYVAQVEGALGKQVVARLESGVAIEGRAVEVHSCRVTASHGGRSIVELVIHEGRNRIVRRLLDEVGHPVVSLSRTQVGPVRLGQLGPGLVRDLTRDELGALLDAVDPS